MRFSIRLLLITTAIVAIAFYYTNLFPREIHSIHRYSSSKNQFPSELVSHFPTNPPSHSSNPIFSFYPGMLQGGAWLQLRIETSKSDAESLANRLNAETTPNVTTTTCSSSRVTSRSTSTMQKMLVVVGITEKLLELRCH